MWRVERWHSNGPDKGGHWIVIADGVSEEEALTLLTGLHARRQAGQAVRPDAPVGQWRRMWTSALCPRGRERYV